MPSSTVRTFTDPDDYAASVRGTKAQLTITGRGRFEATITRVDLHRLWMQRFSDNLPRIGHYALASGRTMITFRTQPGPRQLAAGSEMYLDKVTRHSEAQVFSAFIRVRLLCEHVTADRGYSVHRGSGCRM
jgi:hypothetical protein